MGLRESFDEGAGEIGDEIGAEIPSTPTELRDELPADVEELRLGDDGLAVTDGRQSTNGQEQTSGRPSTDLSIDTVLGETPLDRLL